MRSIALSLAVALGLAIAAPSASAQTLYKLIDKNGKVTYSEKPPKDFDGKVVPMNIDPNANTATLPKPSAAAPAERGGRNSDSPGEKSSSKSEDRVQAARDRLDAAKRALDNALNNPGEGDVMRVGNKGGGARPVFSDGYQAKISGLEAAVKQAEEELKRAEGG